MSDPVLSDLLEYPVDDPARPPASAPERAPAPREARPRAEARRAEATRPPQAMRAYQRSRATVGIAIIGLLFVAAWLLNGYFTARLVAGLWADWATGVTVHLVTSVVEVTTVFVSPALRRVRAPLWVHGLIWLIVLPFGIFDTGSSALGFLEWGLALGAPLGLSLTGGATGFALAVAFIPEPMLVWLAAALRSELRA